MKKSFWITMALVCVAALLVMSRGGNPRRALADETETPEATESPQATPEVDTPETPDDDGNIGIDELDLTDTDQKELANVCFNEDEGYADVPQSEVMLENAEKDSLPTDITGLKGKALVRLLYISVAPAEVDVYMDSMDQPLAGKLKSFKTTPGYLNITAGQHTFIVTPAGNKQNVLLRQTLEVVDQSAFTFVIDTKPAIKPKSLNGVYLMQATPTGLSVYVLRDQLEPLAGAARIILGFFAGNTTSVEMTSPALKSTFPKPIQYSQALSVWDTTRRTANITLVDPAKGNPSVDSTVFSVQKLEVNPNNVYNVIIVSAPEQNKPNAMKAVVLVSPTVNNYPSRRKS